MVDVKYTYGSCAEEIISAFNKDYYLKKALNAPTYENAVVMPVKLSINSNNESTMGGGIDDCNGNFIDGTNVQTGTEVGYNYEDCKYVCEDVVYIGMMHSCYGHMITDCLAKLWYLQTEEYKSSCKPILYLTIAPLKKWQYEILELAGVDLKLLKTVDDVTRFKSIIVPDNSQIRRQGGEHFWTGSFRSTIDLMINNALSLESANIDKKIYLTRTNWNRVYDDYGEDMIEPLFKNAGYSIYSPEKYSVAKQIAIMQGAEELVSTECSAAHNAIFMKNGSKIVLLRKGLYVNYYSTMISQICNLKTIVIDCSMSIINRNGKFAYAGPFFIYPNNNICKYLNIKRKEFPYRKLRNYIKGIWRRKLPEHFVMDNTYAIELQKEIEYSNNLLEKQLLRIIPNPIRSFVKRRIHKIIMNFKIVGRF